MDQEDYSGTISIFNHFDVDEWASWIEARLFDAYSEPELPIRETEHDHALVWVYDHLRGLEQRRSYQEAVTALFESTPAEPVNSKPLYYLLQLIAYTTPRRAKRILRRRLRERLFRELEYGGERLETVLLSVAARYDIDEELIEIIFDLAAEDLDFHQRLAFFRVLAEGETLRALLFLENQLVPYLEDHDSEEMDVVEQLLAYELRGFVYQNGYAELCRWLMDDTYETAETLDTSMMRLKILLRTRVIPWDSDLLETRPYGILVDAILDAGVRPFSAKRMVKVVSVGLEWWEYEEVFNLCQYIWDKSEEKMDTWIDYQWAIGGKQELAVWTAKSHANDMLPFDRFAQSILVQTYWRKLDPSVTDDEHAEQQISIVRIENNLHLVDLLERAAQGADVISLASDYVESIWPNRDDNKTS